MTASGTMIARAANRGRRATPPRVVIDLEKLRHINCGLGRFSLHLGREILALADGRFEPVLFLPRGAAARFTDLGVPFDAIDVAPWRKEAVQRILRPVVRPVLGRPAFAAWHATNQMSRYLPFDPRVPVVLTIHDLNFLHESAAADTTLSARRKLADIQRKVDRAAAIVTDSEFVAADVVRHVDVRGKPVHVVPLGVPEPAAPSAERPAFLPPGPFLFTVGNCLPHKNFHVLLDLVERLPGTMLVIAGKKSTPYGSFLEQEVAARSLSARVHLPGEVSDGDRQWLYGHCEAFLFPSLTEGFGFPVLEAMLCGKPVFLSRRTSLPEIAGDHGVFLEAFDGASLAAAFRDGMRRFRDDPASGAAARRHALSFSWRRMARGYADIYAGVVAAGLSRSA